MHAYRTTGTIKVQAKDAPNNPLASSLFIREKRKVRIYSASSITTPTRARIRFVFFM